jgi:UDP-2,3-diacylglucosamine pyrophosphatase LpxH
LRATTEAEYLEGIRKRLDPLLATARSEDYDAARERIVVFSDHHRGAGDKADDFRSCERAYSAALGFYLEHGYRLFLLGDVEELWEVAKPQKVFDRYGDVLELERQFAERGGGLERFWGNHDDRWASSRAVKKELRAQIGGAPMQEALRLRVARPGGDAVTILFVHGHQGTPDGDRFPWLARLPVRFIWAVIQRAQGVFSTTPAQDHQLRARHDKAMFAWAAERPGRILVAGHTHRPVFATAQPPPPPARAVGELRSLLEEARAAGDAEAAARLAVELEYARTVERRPVRAVTVDPPCYFNTGCCSFPDGDATGIELADGEIRLVRWPRNLEELHAPGTRAIDPERRVLERRSLDEVVNAVAAPPASPEVTERAVTTAPG